MGVGKTTIGKVLAHELGFLFKDSDREVEERSGVDIPWIFDKEGEKGFRDRETAVLTDLCSESGQLIATGGGIITREENRQLIMDNGFVVFLMAPVQELVRRTAKDSKRPLLQTENPEATIKRILSERLEYYREVSDLEIDTLNRSPKAISQKVIAAYRNS